MESLNTTTGAIAPYPSLRPGMPLKMESSKGCSSLHTIASRPLLPPPPFSAITRPTVYTDQYSWEDLSGDSIGPQSQSKAATENTLGPLRPLSYPYNTFMGNIQSMEQHSINMPDHKEYIEPIVARSRRDEGFLRSPPYPSHDQNANGYSAGAIHDNRNGIIRQPTAEDFLRPDHPLPAPRPEEYDSDQDLPVIEPDSYLPEDFDKEHELQHTNARPKQSSVAVTKRHSTITSALAYPKVETKPKYKRSQSELIFPSHVPALTYEPMLSEHNSTPVRAPTIGVDMYQPALGGLQRVSGMQRSDSKRDRVKRFMSGLNPFHRERKFGRQQKG